jgi:hypothetical protein
MLRLRPPTALFVGLVTLTHTGGCTRPSATIPNRASAVLSPNTPTERVGRIVHFLEACPYWQRYSMGKKYTSRRLAIEKNMMEIARFETWEVRKAIVQYLGEPDKDVWMRQWNIHVLNRLIFAVPRFEKGTLPPYRVVPPWNIGHHDRFDILWPWESQGDGSFHLRVEVMGPSSGPIPDPLQQFDVFLKVYGRRKL